MKPATRPALSATAATLHSIEVSARQTPLAATLVQGTSLLLAAAGAATGGLLATADLGALVLLAIVERLPGW